MISWFLSIYPLICSSEALVSFRPLHVFQQWLWPLNVSPISSSLSSSVSHVWSCQVNLPTSQIGLCHCLAMKSILTAHTLQRKRQVLHGTLRDFQGMIFFPGRQRRVQNKPCWWLGKGLSGFVDSCSNLFSILSCFCRPSHMLLTI